MKKMRSAEILIKTFLVVISANAFAQPVTKTQSISKPATLTTPQGSSTVKLNAPQAAAPSTGLHFDFSMETTSNLYKENAAESERSTSFMLYPSFTFQNNYKLSALTYLEKEHTGNEDTNITNTDIALAFPVLNINSLTHLATAVKYTIPTSKASQEVDRLKGAGGVSARIIRDIGESNISYKLSLTKNVHDYTINGNGQANISEKLSQTLGAAIQISKKVSFETALTYGIAQTYAGYRNYAFEYGADLSYEFADKQSIGIGTSNQGSALKADGKTSNMALYDENSSVIRANLNLSF